MKTAVWQKIILLLFINFTISFLAAKAQLRSGLAGGEKIMSRYDMVWDSMSTNYYTGILLGNGQLGANIYKENARSVRIDIGRTDVTDNREELFPGVSKLYTKASLPIGHFSLICKDEIRSVNARLDLYNAQARGQVITSSDTISFIAYVPATRNVIVVDYKSTKPVNAPTLKWNPGRSISPRMLQSYPSDKPENFPGNPAPSRLKVEGYEVSHQALLNDGGYATAWKLLKNDGGESVLISIGYDSHGKTDEIKEAINDIKNYLDMPRGKSLSEHKNWWHKYFRASTINIPDQRMLSFYWAQLYKLACITGQGKPMIDLQGPWTNPTPWPAIWWNLNTQLSYSPVFLSNHLEMGQSLFNALLSHQSALLENVPPGWRSDSVMAMARTSSFDLKSPITDEAVAKGNFEPANLTWTLFYYYQYFSYSGDTAALRKDIYPLLKKAVNFLIVILEKDQQGIYHVPNSLSPEYKSAVDAHYTLSSLQWGLKTLISTSKLLGIDRGKREYWSYLQNHLAPYPVDETGFMIGKDVALTSSHRHYSHLLAIYPYHLINWEQPANRDLIEKSIAHWISMKGALQGYTFTGSASMYATMGNGDKAYELLNILLDRFIQPNTLYRESGPVIETPLAAATSILELLLQCWDDKIRVFPAVPSGWKYASFKDLRAAGAFLVSAVQENGHTGWIKIQSLAGNKCSILTDIQRPQVLSLEGERIPFDVKIENGKRLISFSTVKNQVIKILNPDSKTPYPNGAFRNATIHDGFHWGLNK
ncbi:alpha-L-fucosidase [Chitinophaga caeni]|uniref:Alpha-L-fucosidase n=1 Tax=Chitinophaga caeni TaxID=2029983 RepID=A0A291QWL0_9BACT|nr:alpha-L-fucosidase [Chitinophaga caeni]ATL48272.1 alpha-L-fucosidase [Chitinophaga caeni]